jgi:hypothetical protein
VRRSRAGSRGRSACALAPSRRVRRRPASPPGQSRSQARRTGRGARCGFAAPRPSAQARAATGSARSHPCPQGSTRQAIPAMGHQAHFTGQADPSGGSPAIDSSSRPDPSRWNRRGRSDVAAPWRAPGARRAGRAPVRTSARPGGGRRCLPLADEAAAVADAERRVVRHGPGRPSSLSQYNGSRCGRVAAQPCSRVPRLSLWGSEITVLPANRRFLRAHRVLAPHRDVAATSTLFSCPASHSWRISLDDGRPRRRAGRAARA